MYLQGYAVANKGMPDERTELVYLGEDEHQAYARIREALAKGFELGYTKRGFDVVAYVSPSTVMQVVK